MRYLYLIVFGISMLPLATNAQTNSQYLPANYMDYKWNNVAIKMPIEWYGSEIATRLADRVVMCQKDIGGWSKNVAYHQMTDKEQEQLVKAKHQVGATFDNGSTITELRFIINVNNQIPKDSYKQAFILGLNYIFNAQYDNGGWPQFYPFRTGESVAYAKHITYNDDAMVNVMVFLQELISVNAAFDSMPITKADLDKAKKAFDKGVQCILNTQILVDGKPTVWCAQHHEVSLKPAKARKYELESFSGSESVKVARLLMSIDNPNQEIIKSVNGAAAWFEKHKIEGIKIVTETDSQGKPNRIVVEDEGAKPLWARFYDLETSEPFFCDRDGIKRDSLSQIGYDRRNHYRWYTASPAKFLKQQQEWKNNLNKTN